MGTDKALLAIAGVPMLVRIATEVLQATGSVTVVGDPARYRFAGAPVIEDVIPGSGPLGGIYSALVHSQDGRTSRGWNLVVGCDMPNLHCEFLRELCELREQHAEADVLLPLAGGRPQPLCAMYHQRALPLIEAALARGNLKIMQALAGARIAQIDFPDPAPFRNVNTPEDWHAITQQRPA